MTFAAQCRALLEFALPAVCAVCQAERRAREPGIVCASCWAGVPVLESPICARCGHPEARDGSCPFCPQLPDTLMWGRSWCWVPDAPAGPIVHALKYNGWPSVAEEMADRIVQLGPPPRPRGLTTVLIPVPLAPVRERERGFNQCMRLATALGRRWQLPVRERGLSRLRATRTQTQLTAVERNANVRGCFAARKEGGWERLHVVLVDDVLTTGATLAECAAACLAAGAPSISFVTFGRARTPGDRPHRR